MHNISLIVRIISENIAAIEKSVDYTQTVENYAREYARITRRDRRSDYVE